MVSTIYHSQCQVHDSSQLPSPLPVPIPSLFPSLPQRLPRKTRQDKTRPVDLLVVVPTQLLFLLYSPASQRRLDVPIFILATDHKPDLARRICRDRRVGVLDGGEDLLAGFLQLGDHL